MPHHRRPGRLALTNRIEHLNLLGDELKEHGVQALLQHGALPKAERDRVRNELSAAQPGQLVGFLRGSPSGRAEGSLPRSTRRASARDALYRLQAALR